MDYSVRSAQYYHGTLADRPEEAYDFLAQLADLGINLLAFTAVPVGPSHMQLTLFPEDPERLETEAKRAGLTLDGPHAAILVQGDDELGALARIHERLAGASVQIYASNGIADGRGSYGYLIYLREDQFDSAIDALKS
jgi:hypothetical protein